MKEFTQKFLVIGLWFCLACTSNAQIKTIHLSISQPNVEECITSIENKFNHCDIKIYPNPGAGVFTLEFNNPSYRGQIDLLVFDMSGKKILREEIWLSENIIKTIDLSEYKKGTYILNIHGGANASFKAKLIIF